MPGPNTTALDEAIVDLVSRDAVKVPPYPAVAMRVQDLVRRQDFGLDDLARLVQSDQALAADALRVANSAFYSRGTAVTTLTQAIARIGAQEVARLAVASGLGAHARAPGPLAALKRRVWLESLAAAGLCQELAKRRSLPVEEAFVCGLLHDFGKVITIACIEEIVARRGGRPEPWPLECWLEVVDRYHVELGLVLAARWELPPIVSDVISLHHAAVARLCAAADPRLVELVMAADEVVRLLEDRTWVSPDDLAHIPLLSVQERDLVARVLDRLPGFIASFEGAATALPSASSPLVRGDAGELGGPVPIDHPVRVTVNRQPFHGRAFGIAEKNLLVRAAAPIPENLLLELHVESDPPLTCWATARLSWPDGDGDHAVLLQPFALDGTAHGVWRELLRVGAPEA
jgi:putative nucleotidyltransferase with HDIG domain